MIKNRNIENLEAVHSHLEGRTLMFRPFHLCYECAREDKIKYGEAYWHRVHQLPCVFICPLHNIPLVKVKQEIMNNEIFITADRSEIYERINYDNLNQNFKNLSASFALESLYFLVNYYKIPRNKTLNYNNALKYFGYKPGKRINQQKLHNDFRDYYGDYFLSVMGCKLNNSKGNWISRLVNGRPFENPVKHILLIKFLFNGVENFINFTKDNFTKEKFNSENVAINPFGSGPWPCLNPAHKEYKKNIIENVKLVNSGGKLRGIFECECGFVYSKSPDQLHTNKKFTKKFGRVWEEKLKKLLDNGDSFNLASKKLGVSDITIKKAAKRLNLIPLNVAERSKMWKKQKEFEERLQQKRKQWLRYTEGYEELKTICRRKVYRWLYYYDREWLLQHPKRIKGSGKKEYGWEKDLKILSEVKNVIKNWSILEKNSTVKKTKNRIARQTNFYSTIIQNGYDKIPFTLKYINSVVENSEQFSLRKLEYAYKELKKYDNSITLDKLTKKAGFSEKWYLAKQFMRDK